MNKEYAPPVYNSFLEESYSISDQVEMIHPARFLFNAGATPKSWNLKMLNDPHFSILYFNQKSTEVFPNTDIKGGVVISYWNKNKVGKPIEIFTPFKELDSIRKRVWNKPDSKSLSEIIFNQNKFNLDVLYHDYPGFKKVIGSKGKDKRLRNNIFEKISIFNEEGDLDSDFQIKGLIKNKRVNRYIPRKYIDKEHENLNTWKVLIPSANGSGALGEEISTPLIGSPLIGYTQSFIGIGSFNTEKEANNALKYIKSKFARTMLGILKITQHNPPEKWKYVPLQDFTNSSDIDWSKSIPEIDQQLYKKYGLSPEEIEFIETHVKEME